MNRTLMQVAGILFCVIGIVLLIIGSTAISLTVFGSTETEYHYRGETVMSVEDFETFVEEVPGAVREAVYLGENSPGKVYVRYRFVSDHSGVYDMDSYKVDEMARGSAVLLSVVGIIMIVFGCGMLLTVRKKVVSGVGSSNECTTIL